MTLGEEIEANAKDYQMLSERYDAVRNERVELIKRAYVAGMNVNEIVTVFRTNDSYLAKIIPQAFDIKKEDEYYIAGDRIKKRIVEKYVRKQ